MGKKLDAILGRSFKTTKFKSMVNLGISRLAVLRNQHQARYNVARSDVVQILNLGHHERALLRVEQVIKEQNILDVFVMIENYCYLLIERVNLLEHAKECPEELKEAISSMIYTATRCGEFPELQELRAVFASRFGKEFVARAVELRNNCGVNPKMIQKLSTRMPGMEIRVKVLKEIALENNISLQIEEAESIDTEVKMDDGKKEDQTKANLSNDSKPTVLEDVVSIEGFSNSMKMRRKYKDVADAAQAAFESAAYAAEAARAAVELSRSDSPDSDDPTTMVLESPRHIESKLETSENKHTKNRLEEFEESEKEAKFNRSLSTSSLDSEDNNLNQTQVHFEQQGQTRPRKMEITFDESDEETSNIRNSFKNLTLQTDEVLSSGKVYDLKDDAAGESEMEANDSSDKHFPLKSQAGSSTLPLHESLGAHLGEDQRSDQKEGRLDLNKKPASVRTRRTYRR